MFIDYKKIFVSVLEMPPSNILNISESKVLKNIVVMLSFQKIMQRILSPSTTNLNSSTDRIVNTSESDLLKISNSRFFIK